MTQTTVMYDWAIIVAVVFFVLILPLSLRFQTFYSSEQKRLYYSIVLFRVIYVYSGYLRFVQGKVLQTSFRGKSSFVDLRKVVPKKGQITVGPSIFRYAEFTKFNLFFEVGKDGDAFLPVLASGFLQALTGSLMALIRAKNKRIDMNRYVIVKLNRNVFEVTGDSILQISTIAFLYAIIKDTIVGKIKKMRLKEQEEKL